MGDTRIENCTGYPCWCSWGSLIRIASLTPADGSNSMIPISKLYLVLFLYLRWQVTWRVTTQPTMITFLRFVLPQLFLDLLQVDFLWVLTKELFAWKDLDHILNSLGTKWLTYAVSKVASNITPLIGELSSRHRWKFQPINFAQTCEKSLLKWHNQPEKN